MTDHRNKFSFMGILLLLIGIALAVTGWIVTQGVTDGIQYIVSAPEDKDALKDAYREAQVLLSSLTDLVDLAVVSGKAQNMTLSTDISETEGTVYAVDLGFFDLRPEALKDGRLISGGDIKDCRDVILIDESTAYQLFPAGDALGKTILLGGQIWTVVGVVKDRARFGEADRSLAYIPITAAITKGQPIQTLEICIRRGKGETPTASLQSALTGWRGGGTFYELSKEKAAARIPLRWCAVILGCCLIRWLLHLLTDYAKRQYALLREKLQAQYATRLIGWATGRIVMLLLGFLLAGIAAYAVLSLITKAALIFPEWVPDKPFSPTSYVSCFWSLHQNAALSVQFASREKAILLLGARLIRWGCFAWMAGCTIMYLRSFVISKLYNNTMRRKSS